MKLSNVKSVAALILILSIGLSGVPLANQLKISEVWVGQSHVKASNIIANDDIIDTLPSASISLFLDGGFPGTTINATLSFGFSEFGDGDMGVGFEQEYLVVENSVGAVAVTGLGYDEMREYPFIYYEDGVFSDYWTDGNPSWISFRPYAAWTETSAIGLWLGPIPSENITRLTKTGDIIEFENLTVYFEDGSSFVCGPRLITVGVNFTQQEGVWETNMILEVSNETGVTIGGDNITVVLQGQVPLHPVFLVTVVAIPITITLVGIAIIYLRRRLRSRTTLE